MNLPTPRKPTIKNLLNSNVYAQMNLPLLRQTYHENIRQKQSCLSFKTISALPVHCKCFFRLKRQEAIIAVKLQNLGNVHVGVKRKLCILSHSQGVENSGFGFSMSIIIRVNRLYKQLDRLCYLLSLFDLLFLCNRTFSALFYLVGFLCCVSKLEHHFHFIGLVYEQYLLICLFMR